MWTYNVDIQCGHTMWTYNVDIQCGHTMWTYNVDKQCGQTMWTIFTLVRKATVLGKTELMCPGLGIQVQDEQNSSCDKDL